MKMAQAREARKDNKGFSLVELIIVIAIMVALVAMLAPQFVKYVSKSRDAVISSAAEDVLATAKSEFALTNLTFASTVTNGNTATIKIGRNGKIGATGDENKLGIVMTGLDFDSSAQGAGCTFEQQCGIDTTKKTTSDLWYLITITNNNSSPTFTMQAQS